jgi:2-polyprenyl-3-methyl-5-hydroxy-6-metoxy-1,4-benzoquinol methylase
MHPRALADPPAYTADAGVRWDESPCPMCAAADDEPLFEAADPTPPPGEPARRFLVVRCRQCRLVFTNPRPDADDIRRFYPPDYRPHRPRKPAPARKPHPFERLLGRPSAERRGALPWAGVGRLLDFGCGGGSFLKRMADLGWDVTGVDTSAAAVQAVTAEFGLKAVAGSLPHPDLRPSSFEVVTMWHSLEHVHDPLAVLREAYHLLIPGGRLVVACPNIDSWAFRRYAESWFGLDLPRHLTHFTPPTLTRMLQTAGLRVTDVRGVRHSDWLRASAKRASGTPLGDWLDRVFGWKPAAKVASWAVYTMGQSDCLLAVAERPEA